MFKTFKHPAVVLTVTAMTLVLGAAQAGASETSGNGVAQPTTTTAIDIATATPSVKATPAPNTPRDETQWGPSPVRGLSFSAKHEGRVSPSGRIEVRRIAKPVDANAGAATEAPKSASAAAGTN